jgi:alpha-1,2-mannosyltransferase
MLWAALVVFVGSLWLDVRFIEGTLERISTNSMEVHADFDTFWRSAAAMWEGEDAYRTDARLENLNPPFWTVLMAPFGLMEPLVAYRWFILVSVCLVTGYLAWTAREARLGGEWAVVAVGALLLSSPLLATLALGQVYPVLALGLVAAWAADQHGRDRLSGASLGLVVAIKPSLAPVLLWYAVRRRWGGLVAALVAGAAATLIGLVALGPGATLDWIRLVLSDPLSTYWDNASLPSAAARLFTPNEFARPLAVLPPAVPLAYLLGIAVVFLTAARARDGSGFGMWSLVAASLLASPVAWHNYLVLLGPGIVLLLARGRAAVALLLLSLHLIPPQWPLLWQGQSTALASLMLTLYFLILLIHWVAFLVATGDKSGRVAD